MNKEQKVVFRNQNSFDLLDACDSDELAFTLKYFHIIMIDFISSL